MIDERSPIGEYAQNEPYRDSVGNYWIEGSPYQTPLLSILTGKPENRTVVSEEAVQLSNTVQPKDLLERVAREKFVLGNKISEGSEARIVRFNDASFRMASWLGAKRLEGVVKHFRMMNPQVDTPIQGWETMQLMDAIRPAFQRAGLNLLSPYAGSNRSLYSPLIEGGNLEWMLERMARADALLADNLHLALGEVALPVHQEVLEILQQEIASHGFDLRFQGDSREDNVPYIFLRQGSQWDMVGMMPDFYTPPKVSLISKDDRGINRYRNWVLSKEGVQLLNQGGELPELVDVVRSHAVIVDPFFVKGSKSMLYKDWIEGRPTR